MANFGAAKIWHKFLNTMAKFGTTFPDHGIRTSIHTKFSQRNFVLGIERGVSGSTVQYFKNYHESLVSKQGSYLEHDVVLNTTTPQTASVLEYHGEIRYNFVVLCCFAIPNYAHSKFSILRYATRIPSKRGNLGARAFA